MEIQYHSASLLSSVSINPSRLSCHIVTFCHSLASLAWQVYPHCIFSILPDVKQPMHYTRYPSPNTETGQLFINILYTHHDHEYSSRVWSSVYTICRVSRGSRKKAIFLVARPLIGGGGKSRATKKITFLRHIFD